MKSPTTERTPQAADKYVVRFPDGMRCRIAELAKQNNRSMNAEIIKRLEWGLSMEGPATHREPPKEISSDLPFLLSSEIGELAEDNGVPFEEMLMRIFYAGIHKDAPQVLYLAIQPGATIDEVRTALEASKGIVRPDATIVSEMIARRPIKKSPKG